MSVDVTINRDIIRSMDVLERYTLTEAEVKALTSTNVKGRTDTARFVTKYILPYLFYRNRQSFQQTSDATDARKNLIALINAEDEAFDSDEEFKSYQKYLKTIVQKIGDMEVIPVMEHLNKAKILHNPIQVLSPETERTTKPKTYDRLEDGNFKFQDLRGKRGKLTGDKLSSKENVNLIQAMMGSTPYKNKAHLNVADKDVFAFENDKITIDTKQYFTNALDSIGYDWEDGFLQYDTEEQRMLELQAKISRKMPNPRTVNAGNKIIVPTDLFGGEDEIEYPTTTNSDAVARQIEESLKKILDAETYKKNNKYEEDFLDIIEDTLSSYNTNSGRRLDVFKLEIRIVLPTSAQIKEAVNKIKSSDKVSADTEVGDLSPNLFPTVIPTETYGIQKESERKLLSDISDREFNIIENIDTSYQYLKNKTGA